MGAKPIEESLCRAHAVEESGLAYLRLFCPLRLAFFLFRRVAMEAWTLARAVTLSDAVSLGVVPAQPMGMHTRSNHRQYRRSVVTKGLYFSNFR